MTVDDCPTTCISTTHFQYPRLAVGYYVSPGGYCYHYCETCANRVGTELKKYNYKWVKLTPNQCPSLVQEVQSGSHD